MLTRLQFTTITLLGALSMVLMVADVVLFTQNRAVQAEIAARAQYIQQSVQLQPLYQEMVKALADLSVRRQDDALRELLARQGISLPQPQAPFAAPAPDAKGAPRK